MKSRQNNALGTAIIQCAALFSVGLLSFLIVMLIFNMLHLTHIPISAILRFFTSSDWQPSIGLYGGLGFLKASLSIAFLAVLLSLPIALFLALFITEYVNLRMRRFYTAFFEISSAIPTVLYGFFALIVLIPMLQKIFDLHRMQTINSLSAALVLSVFLMPKMTSMMIHALDISNRGIRDAALAIGATHAEAIVRIVIPDALPGLLSAILMGFSRALGESVIVGMLGGISSRIPLVSYNGVETMSGYILHAFQENPGTIYLMTALLFFLTFSLNILGEWIARSTFVKELR